MGDLYELYKLINEDYLVALTIEIYNLLNKMAPSPRPSQTASYIPLEQTYGFSTFTRQTFNKISIWISNSPLQPTTPNPSPKGKWKRLQLWKDGSYDSSSHFLTQICRELVVEGSEQSF